MDEGVKKLSFLIPAEQNTPETSNDEIFSKPVKNRNEVNSWDCSTPTSNEDLPRGKASDWDSGSECQETMVVPFDSNLYSKDNDLDSKNGKEEEKQKLERRGTIFPISICSVMSSGSSAFDLSEISLKINDNLVHNEELLLEDFEEFWEPGSPKESAKTGSEPESGRVEEAPPPPRTEEQGTENEKVRSNQPEGTPEDTAIWMVAKSERTQSKKLSSKLISSSDRENLDKLNETRRFLKKTKSLADLQKSRGRRRTGRTSRSEYLGIQKNNYNNFLFYEGSVLKRKLEIESEKAKENISGCKSFDRTRVFFTEFECRAFTVETPSKSSLTSVSANSLAEDTATTEENAAVDETPPENHDESQEVDASIPAPASPMTRAGPSGGLESMDAFSLPDMVGKKSEAMIPKKVQSLKDQETKSEEPAPSDILEESSWLLLDNAGNYQMVSENLVSILLNGRSAEAVLQGRKEHFIPKAALADTASLKDSLSNLMAQESIQNMLKEEDLGGEDDRKRVIDLERKTENTLFYIQPGMSQTACLRIIPVNTEMIHVWKRAKEGSTQSLEDDLTNSSHDSVISFSQRPPLESLSSTVHRQVVEETVSEEDEIQPEDPTTVNRHTVPALSELHKNDVAEFSELLFETRKIVDSLTTNFNALQNRLEGETNRSLALQGEVDMLRIMLKKYGGKLLEGNCGESLLDATSIHSSHLSANPSLFAFKDNYDVRSECVLKETSEGNHSRTTFSVEDKSTGMESQIAHEGDNITINEDPEFLTVDIYTVESLTRSCHDKDTQEHYSMVHSNLKTIEDKMRNLQAENDCVVKQNAELKRKLREISLELEKYLGTTSQQELYMEESKEVETPRDQVCNLKLELEKLKMLVRDQKRELTEENSLLREESNKCLFRLQNWCTAAGEMIQKIETAKNKLEDSEIVLDIDLEPDSTRDPRTFSKLLDSFVEQTVQVLVKLKNENLLFEETLKEDFRQESVPSKEISGLDQVISGYAELIEQCRKGQITGETESKVMEDYVTVIMEKASLMEEIKILKTENELLLEGQLEHYEKLKQTMIALKDRKSEVTALESSQKLLEEERRTMEEVLKLSEEEKKTLELEIKEKNQTLEGLAEEMRKKDIEMADCSERLSAALNEIKNFEKSSRLKDELINELKMENGELVAAGEKKNSQIEILREEIKNLDLRRTNLEAELASSKLLLSESQKEMTDYITHLEGLVNSLQESLDKMKQKMKEVNQTVSRLKSENDVLDKQHQCDVKLFNNTKDELDSVKEKLSRVENKLKESEEEREASRKKCESLADSEKEKSEALKLLTKEYREVLRENAELVEKVKIFSKDKDDSLKEQKELINKYALLSKEIQRLQDKYRSVKSECNERTDVIKYLETMLKENLVEYNARIACLEQNISRIIEKIVACKKGMREKHVGVDAEVKELRNQLEGACRERKEMENVVNNYYSLTKRLEHEIEEREKKVDELHAKLSLEQRKTLEESERSSFHVVKPPETTDCFKTEQLERQMAMTESELAECKKELQRCRSNYENEKKKLELTIADLRSEIERYKLRIEVMMRNISNCNRSMSGSTIDKKSGDDSDIHTLKKELHEKDKIITELNDAMNKCKAELKLKESDLENSKKKCFYQEEELKHLQNQIAKLQDVMTAAGKKSEMQQKERDEMAEKLFQSIKLIIEERSARQTIEALLIEKEKNFINQVDETKNELFQKIKEWEAVTEALEEKKKLISKLQDDLKKMKSEMSLLRGQVNSCKKRTCCGGAGDGGMGEEHSLHASLPSLRQQNVSSERLESCLKELKEIRDLNLELRKSEGQYQAKIVRLEDEVRDARLLIKELQGDIKTEKKSKKALKNMIMAAKMEIEKCVLTKQLMSVIAERISRHLELSDIPSREFLSGFRLSDSTSSFKSVPG